MNPTAKTTERRATAFMLSALQPRVDAVEEKPPVVPSPTVACRRFAPYCSSMGAGQNIEHAEGNAGRIRQPEYEALDYFEVKQMVRAEVPELADEEVEVVVRAVMSLVPVPPELGERLRRAAADLEGLYGFLAENAVRGDRGVALLRCIKEYLRRTLGIVRVLRDRFPRRCEHVDTERQPDGSVWCRGCGLEWTPKPNQATDAKPGRLLFGRHLLPDDRKQDDKSPRRANFVYLITEYLKSRGYARGPALRIAGRLMAMFWNDGKPPYADDIALQEAYAHGRRAEPDSSLASVEEFVQYFAPVANFADFLIWVPVRRPGLGGT